MGQCFDFVCQVSYYWFYRITSLIFNIKLIYVFHKIVLQCGVDVFFIDWEKPRGQQSFQESESKNRLFKESSSVSVWRTILVANQWSSLQV